MRSPVRQQRLRILALVALTAATLSCSKHQSAQRREQPCILYEGSATPLLVGETVQFKIGRMVNSHCLPSDARADTWESDEPEVVRVELDGLIRGIAPGDFNITARVGSTVLESAGFVLPPGWTPRIDPPEATIRVGETASFCVVAYDAEGRPLPPVWFSVYTAEFFNIGGPGPPVDMWSRQNIRTCGVFRGVRPGRTTLFGVIGHIGGMSTKRVEAQLTVLPTDPSHAAP